MSKYSKAIAAFVGTGGPSLLADLGDGLTGDEWLRAFILGTIAAVTVWAAPKNADA